MKKKVYLRFRIEDFEGGKSVCQIVYQDRRFKFGSKTSLIEAGSIFSITLDHNNYIKKITLGDDSVVVRNEEGELVFNLNANNEPIYGEYKGKHHIVEFPTKLKKQLKNELLQFPLWPEFNKDFYPFKIELRSDPNTHLYTFYKVSSEGQSSWADVILEYKCWNNENKRFIQINYQTDDLRGKKIILSGSNMYGIAQNPHDDLALWTNELCLRGSLPELDANVDCLFNVNTCGVMTIDKMNSVVRQALENYYTDTFVDGIQPKLHEVSPYMWEVYCDIAD